MIYQGDYFYKYILNSSKKVIENIDEDKLLEDYQLIKIPKKDGYRIIHALKSGSQLSNLQKGLYSKFVIDIPVSEVCYGFVKDKSYMDFLSSHCYINGQTRNYLKIDIKNFFNSITTEMIVKNISPYIKTKSEEDNKAILNQIIKLVSVDGVLPQGAITSPAISNIVFRRVDIRLLRYCSKMNIKYTRYADDILFSSENKVVLKEFFLRTISRILKDDGFLINYKKVKYGKDSINFNGYCLAKELRLSRKKIAFLNKMLFLCERNIVNSNQVFYIPNDSRSKSKQYFTLEGIINYLNGQRSFFINYLRFHSNPVKVEKTKLQIERIEDAVNKLNIISLEKDFSPEVIIV